MHKAYPYWLALLHDMKHNCFVGKTSTREVNYQRINPFEYDHWDLLYGGFSTEHTERNSGSIEVNTLDCGPGGHWFKSQLGAIIL